MELLLAIFFGMPGWAEMMIVLAIMLLLFGHRLPSVMRNLGRSVNEFKDGLSESEDHPAGLDEKKP